MSEATAPNREIRRILVALDTSVDSEAALAVAAELAAILEAELIGLHIEDVNLARLAEHPLSFEVEYFSARRRHLHGPELERQLRMQVVQVRRRLLRVSSRHRLRSSFQTVRGGVLSQLLAGLADADLVGVGARGRARGHGLGSTVEALLGRGAGPLLVLRRGMRLGHAVYVWHDGTEEGREALDLALQLLRRESMELTVLIDAVGERRRRLEKELRQWLDEREVAAALRHLPAWARGAEDLALFLRRRGAGLFVTARRSLGYDRREFGRFLSRLPCPLLVTGHGARENSAAARGWGQERGEGD